MTPDQYRFSGYQLPLIQLDSTGPSYLYIKIPAEFLHPQPEYWQKPYYRSSPMAPTPSYDTRVDSSVSVTKQGKLYPVLPLNPK